MVAAQHVKRGVRFARTCPLLQEQQALLISEGVPCWVLEEDLQVPGRAMSQGYKQNTGGHSMNECAYTAAGAGIMYSP